jgi:two-component system chemotaxis response regulator CheB
VERALARSLTSGRATAGRRPIRLMIVDDSMVARAVLSRMIESDGAFEIAAVAGTAEDAIDALRAVRVDVVLLDLEMPGAGGLKSLPGIIRAALGAKVMIVSSLAEEGAEETVAALALGAADTLPKPGTGRFNGRFSEILLARLKALGHASAADIAPRQQSGFTAPLRAMSSAPGQLLAIGASTGGIHALGTFFQALPGQIGVPILVTQHLPVPFIPVFARQLGVSAGRRCAVAEDGMPVCADEILLAPGDSHLTVEARGDGRLYVHLNTQKAPSGCLPSLDPMFASAADAVGAGALGIVLTGIGRDGVQGASRLVAAGGSIIVQDEGSSAVWGMPRAALDAGLACAILPPDKIAARVASRTGEGTACK